MVNKILGVLYTQQRALTIEVLDYFVSDFLYMQDVNTHRLRRRATNTKVDLCNINL
jgi:hypothetical protein